LKQYVVYNFFWIICIKITQILVNVYSRW
jgi:hypothetical protein